LGKGSHTSADQIEVSVRLIGVRVIGAVVGVVGDAVGVRVRQRDLWPIEQGARSKLAQIMPRRRVALNRIFPGV
jgi:hypothetical protein